jgi:hypothetical protein
VPRVEVVLFADEDGSVPLLAWLDAQSSKAKEKCIVRLERLSEMGHELRRPEADYLRDDIHELRVSHRRGPVPDALLFLRQDGGGNARIDEGRQGA